jgi:hypothetical protein
LRKEASRQRRAGPAAGGNVGSGPGSLVLLPPPETRRGPALEGAAALEAKLAVLYDALFPDRAA